MRRYCTSISQLPRKLSNSRLLVRVWRVARGLRDSGRANSCPYERPSGEPKAAKFTLRVHAARCKAFVQGARASTLIPPQLTQLAEAARSGPQWVHEIKLDGFRMAARIERGRAQLLTRTGLDWSDKYPSVVAALAKVAAKTAYLDGELCGVGDDGLPSFSQTQAASDGERGVRLVYYAFDLLHLDGLGACRCLILGEMGFEPLKPVGEPDAANSRIRFDVRLGGSFAAIVRCTVSEVAKLSRLRVRPGTGSAPGRASRYCGRGRRGPTRWRPSRRRARETDGSRAPA